MTTYRTLSVLLIVVQVVFFVLLPDHPLAMPWQVFAVIFHALVLIVWSVRTVRRKRRPPHRHHERRVLDMEGQMFLSDCTIARLEGDTERLQRYPVEWQQYAVRYKRVPGPPPPPMERDPGRMVRFSLPAQEPSRVLKFSRREPPLQPGEPPAATLVREWK